MAKEVKKPEAKAAPIAAPMSVHTFVPTAADSFRMVRARGLPLWAIQVRRVEGGKLTFEAELDPPDTIEAIERKIIGLVQEVERR